MRDAITAVEALEEELAADLADKQQDIEALETEKELQAGGEVKELGAAVDALSKRWVVGGSWHGCMLGNTEHHVCCGYCDVIAHCIRSTCWGQCTHGW